jgi:hypothetical protein
MDTTARKIDDYTIEISKAIPAYDKKDQYDLKFLLKQRDDIQKSKDDFCALRDAELKEVNHIIWHCEQEGLIIKEEPIEKVPVDNLPTAEEIIKPLIKTKRK